MAQLATLALPAFLLVMLPTTAHSATSDPGSPANPAGWSISVGSTALLEASGYAALVDATITCPVGVSNAQTQIVFTKNGTAIGRLVTSPSYPCKGQPEDVLFAVVSTTGQKRLPVGAVTVRAGAFSPGSGTPPATTTATVALNGVIDPLPSPPTTTGKKPFSMVLGSGGQKAGHAVITSAWYTCPAGTRAFFHDARMKGQTPPLDLDQAPNFPSSQAGLPCSGHVQHVYLIGTDVNAFPGTSGVELATISSSNIHLAGITKTAIVSFRG